MIRPVALTRTDLPNNANQKQTARPSGLNRVGTSLFFVCVIARTGAFANRSGGQKPLRKTPVPPFEALKVSTGQA